MIFALSMAALALPLPPAFVALNSSAGVEMLDAVTTMKVSYDQAAIHMVSQIDQHSCGRASATIVLNALAPQSAPVAPAYAPYAYWTQDNYIGDAGQRTPLQQCVASNCTAPCSLDQEVGALNCVQGLIAVAYHAETIGSAATLEALIRGVVGKREIMIVANFAGGEAMHNLNHSGHFSPIVAITADTPAMVLVLDVSRYKYPPWWVPIDVMWSGINTASSDKTSRGIYLAYKHTTPPPPGVSLAPSESPGPGPGPVDTPPPKPNPADSVSQHVEP